MPPQARGGAEAATAGDLVDWEAPGLEHLLGQPDPLT
jgi:hypothetical protein